MAEFKEIQRSKYLPDLIADQIMSQISSGELKPGDCLPTETALGEIFGVSRNVVREAIARLRSDGVLATKQGRGAVVNPLSERNTFRVDIAALQRHENLTDLFELRSVLEIEAASLAASRRSDKHLQDLSGALTQLDGAEGFDERRVEADALFHRVLGDASGNEYLATIIAYLASRLKDTVRATDEIYADKDLLSLTVKEHQDILTAVEKQDAQSAGDAMRVHIRGAATRLGVKLPGA